jgi:hypothetical protein
MLAIVDRLIQKKSLAAMPMVENNNPSHSVKIENATGFAFGNLQ